MGHVVQDFVERLRGAAVQVRRAGKDRQERRDVEAQRAVGGDDVRPRWSQFVGCRCIKRAYVHQETCELSASDHFADRRRGEIHAAARPVRSAVA